MVEKVKEKQDGERYKPLRCPGCGKLVLKLAWGRVQAKCPRCGLTFVAKVEPGGCDHPEIVI